MLATAREKAAENPGLLEVPGGCEADEAACLAAALVQVSLACPSEFPPRGNNALSLQEFEMIKAWCDQALEYQRAAEERPGWAYVTGPWSENEEDSFGGLLRSEADVRVGWGPVWGHRAHLVPALEVLTARRDLALAPKLGALVKLTLATAPQGAPVGVQHLPWALLFSELASRAFHAAGWGSGRRGGEEVRLERRRGPISKAHLGWWLEKTGLRDARALWARLAAWLAE